MKINYQCSNCAKRFQVSAIPGVPEGMFLNGCRVVGDAFYCEECVKTWKDRNKEEFDIQYKEPKKMFVKWWNRIVDEQAKVKKKAVKTYRIKPNGDYIEM